MLSLSALPGSSKTTSPWQRCVGGELQLRALGIRGFRQAAPVFQQGGDRRHKATVFCTLLEISLSPFFLSWLQKVEAQLCHTYTAAEAVIFVLAVFCYFCCLCQYFPVQGVSHTPTYCSACVCVSSEPVKKPPTICRNKGEKTAPLNTEKAQKEGI